MVKCHYFIHTLMFADATETLVHLMKFIFYLYAYDFTLLMHLYLFNNS